MEILTFPNELLRRVSKDIDLSNEKEKEKIHGILEEMKHLMYHSNGIGLAAPQVGIAKRFFIIDIEQKVEKDEDGNISSITPGRLHVFINPKFISKEGELVYEEGCLSVPGVWEEVKRAQKVTIEYYDVDFKSKKMVADGLMAIAVQHEYDHLDGKLFIDRLPMVKRTMIKNKIIKGKAL